MLRKIVIALTLVSCCALAAGCQTDDAALNAKDLSVAMPNGGQEVLRMETRSIEHTFPSGQTANVFQYQWVDPQTGKTVEEGTYAFSGKSMGRAVVENVTGAVIPAGLTGLGVYEGDKAIKASSIITNGGVALSASSAKASSIVRVGPPLKLGP